MNLIRIMPAEGEKMENKKVNYCSYAFVVTLLTTSYVRGSLAEEPTLLPEVSVSSTTIEAPLQLSPVSASVKSSEEITDRSADNIQQLIDFVPNLNFSGGTSRPRFFQIRGVGELEQYEGAPNPSVGYFVDGLDLSGLGGSSTLFDIDQVEVLRGPQSIRYGANALAGTISYNSKDPSAKLNGITQISGGTDEYRSGGAAVGGAVDGTNEKLLFRVSAFNLRSDGFRKNLFLDRDDTNKRDETTARVKLKALPSEWLEVDLTGMWFDYSNGYDAFALNNAFTTQSDRPGRDVQRTAGTVLKTKIRLGEIGELTNTTSYSNSDNDYGFDGDWGNPPLWEPYNPYDYRSSSFRQRDTFSEELRVSSRDDSYTHGENSRWVGGLYLQTLDEETHIDELASEEIYDQLDSQYIGRTYAIFGQYELPIQKGLSLTSGLRGEIRGMDYDDSTGSSFDPINRMWGGHLTLGYDIDEANYAYALVSRGFKGGGFNAGPSVPAGNRIFSPEALWNIETGVKSELIERRLRLNTSLFSMFRRSQQVKFGFQENPNDPLSFIYLTDNAAQGVNLGLETELTFIASESLELFAAGSLLDTEFRDYAALGRDLTGREQSSASPWQLALGAKVLFSERIYARLDYTARDSFYFDDAHDQKSEPYNIFNLSLGYDYGPFKAQLWARNLFDERYAVRGFFFGNEPPDFPNKLYIQRGDPFQAGFTLTYQFDTDA